MSLSLGLLNKVKENQLRQTAIEEFRDKLKNLKNTLNEIKKTWIIERTSNQWNKKWTRKRAKYAEWWNEI